MEKMLKLNLRQGIKRKMLPGLSNSRKRKVFVRSNDQIDLQVKKLFSDSNQRLIVMTKE